MMQALSRPGRAVSPWMFTNGASQFMCAFHRTKQESGSTIFFGEVGVGGTAESNSKHTLLLLRRLCLAVLGVRGSAGPPGCLQEPLEGNVRQGLAGSQGDIGIVCVPIEGNAANKGLMESRSIMAVMGEMGVESRPSVKMSKES